MTSTPNHSSVINDAIEWLRVTDGTSSGIEPDQESWKNKSTWMDTLYLRTNNPLIPHLSRFTELLASNGYALNQGEATPESRERALAGEQQVKMAQKVGSVITQLLQHKASMKEAFLLMRYRDEVLKKDEPANAERIKETNALLAQQAPLIVNAINNRVPKDPLGTAAIIKVGQEQAIGVC